MKKIIAVMLSLAVIVSMGGLFQEADVHAFYFSRRNNFVQCEIEYYVYDPHAAYADYQRKREVPLDVFDFLRDGVQVCPALICPQSGNRGESDHCEHRDDADRRTVRIDRHDLKFRLFRSDEQSADYYQHYREKFRYQKNILQDRNLFYTNAVVCCENNYKCDREGLDLKLRHERRIRGKAAQEKISRTKLIYLDIVLNDPSRASL